jgi:hypothetical protein
MEGAEYFLPPYGMNDPNGGGGGMEGSGKGVEATLKELSHLVIILLFLAASFPVCIVTNCLCLCKPNRNRTLLPVTDKTIYSHPTNENPFLKLRVHSNSNATEDIIKPVLL